MIKTSSQEFSPLRRSVTTNVIFQNPDSKPVTTHYVLFVIVYALYGYQVCPFLEQLPIILLVVPVIIVLCVQLILRVILKHLISHSCSLQRQVKLLFATDVGLFVIGGTSLSMFNQYFFGFPMESGGKVLFGFSSLGFYIALDCALYRECKLARFLRKAARDIPISPKFLPYQYKFAIFSAVNLFILASICLMVIYKDLVWTTETSPDPDHAQKVIMAELIFVIVVLSTYIMRIIHQYTLTVSETLADETATLAKVQNGNFEAHVTVTSNDEFGQVAKLTNDMIDQLKSSREKLARAQDVTMMSLVSLAEKRDNETGMHIRRTQAYVAILAEALRQTQQYKLVMTDDVIDMLYKSAPLHDIGKVGIPDAILNKPGKLTDEEFDIMKTHTTIGVDALEDTEHIIGSCSFLAMAREIAATHHEKWDGTGYPNGLKKLEIPLSGRIMAIADVYDALRSERVYKPAFSHDKARDIIADGSGKHFDPDMVEAFLLVEKIFADIAAQMQENNSNQDIRGRPIARTIGENAIHTRTNAA
ncbi:MAG: hypothetical protein COB90_00730 [Hyphomicrobiales bacterium]|nr:MAG: hypothetical protein COB90_00730 [Hyphomicrobiales bacterium]